jgi:hypothetical protein
MFGFDLFRSQRVLHTGSNAVSMYLCTLSALLRTSLKVRGHCVCKEVPVIPVNRAVDPKKNNREKMEGRGGGEAQGVADPPPPKKKEPVSRELFSDELSFGVIASAVFPRTIGHVTKTP